MKLPRRRLDPRHAGSAYRRARVTFGRELAARKEKLGITEVWIDRERGWRGVALRSSTASLMAW
jgi:hypothetical protein